MAKRKEWWEGKFYRIGYKHRNTDGIIEETDKRRAMQIAKDLINRHSVTYVWICKFIRNKDKSETEHEYLWEWKISKNAILN